MDIDRACAIFEISKNEALDKQLIKKKYKELVFKYHPDKYKEADASQKLKEINEANQFLSNYDPSKKPNHFDINFDFSVDFISEKNIPLLDIDYILEVPLKNIVYGTSAKFKYKRKNFCNCLRKQTNCNICNGSGLTDQEIEAAIVIPPGIPNGHQFKLSGGGNCGFVAKSRIRLFGNLSVTIRYNQDKDLFIKDNVLIKLLNVDFSDAVLGCMKEFDLFGTKIDLKIEPKSKNGDIVLVPHRGIAQKDLHVKLNVDYPDWIVDYVKEKREK